MGSGATEVRKWRILAVVAALALATVAVTGCGGKKDRGDRVVAAGDRVRVQYTGKLDDGTVFERSDPETPLEFVVGSGDLSWDLGDRRLEQGFLRRVLDAVSTSPF